VLERIGEEFASRQGEFARVLDGRTPQSTRQLLQLAFNREHSYPRVLVAQSTVGREGLNLHKACRTVILLHPEWNPGVVEQQIGRVDRLGSLWERLLRGAIDAGLPAAELPRIEVKPVIFAGTYDEMQWEVLHSRWDDLRAQLHGVVVTPRLAAEFGELTEVIEAINAAAPNFSPSR
jgi:superfamily II DNA or RNA helicase